MYSITPDMTDTANEMRKVGLDFEGLWQEYIYYLGNCIDFGIIYDKKKQYTVRIMDQLHQQLEVWLREWKNKKINQKESQQEVNSLNLGTYLNLGCNVILIFDRTAKKMEARRFFTYFVWWWN